MEAVEDPVVLLFPEVVVEEIPGVMLRIGLNDTTLTRALLRGHYMLAEDIIDETTDIDFLNDGALTATPLNIVLTGPGGQYQQPRNLKLARLLLLKGANPNIRIPNQDLESASESPLELILRFYLKLLEVFTVSSSGLIKENYSTALETELMDCIGINGELGGLTPRLVVEHTRELLHLCLEQGGDPNLPTTDAARTIFHLALIAPVPDSNLIQKLLDLGANINHADVHNTTPLMDLVLLADEHRVLQELKRIEEHRQVPVLDNQNCTLQSALFRAVFQGKLKTATSLLESGADPALCARTQQEGDVGSYLVNRSVYTGTPPLLAPLLGNSPCWWRYNHQSVTKSSPKCKSHRDTSSSSRRLLHRLGGKSQDAGPRFQIEAADKLIRECVSPLVDHGAIVTDPVAQSLFHLVRCLTQHRHIADSKKVDPKSAISLMFGQTTAGLRQLAVRAIMKQVLFNSTNSERIMEMLKQNCIKHGYTPFLLSVTPSMASIQDNGSIVHEFMLEPDSELELSLESTYQRGEQEREDIDRLITQINSHLDRPLPPVNNSRQDEPLTNLHAANMQDNLHSEPVRDADLQAVSNLQHSSHGHDSPPGLVPGASQDMTEQAGASSFSNVIQDPVNMSSEPISNLGHRLPSLCLNTTDLIERYEALLANTNRLYNHYFKNEGSSVKEDADVSDMDTEKSTAGDHILPPPAEDAAADVSQLQLIKSFSDLKGLPQEDVNKGKRLLLIQMLHNMDPNRLSPADQELIDLNPNVEDQLVQLSRKLQVVRLSTNPATASSFGEDVDLPDCTQQIQKETNPANRNDTGHNAQIEKCKQVSELSNDEILDASNAILSESSPIIPVITDNMGPKFTHVLLNDPMNSTTMVPATAAGHTSHENRMQLDENWSLGSIKNLEPAGGSLMNSASRSLQSINHSVEIVKSLEVKVTVSMDDDEMVGADVMKSKDRHSFNHDIENVGCGASPDGLVDVEPEFLPEPETSMFIRGPHQLTRLLSSASDYTNESPPLSPLRDDSDSESSLEEGASTMKNLSLKHTCCRPYPGEPHDDGPVISYLSAQVLDALTLELGIPTSLRPCFSLEAARLQIALVLAANHSIHCDRNCEGDESDMENEDDEEDDDSEDNLDIADSDTDSDQFRVPIRYASSSRHSTSSSSPTSISNISSIGFSIRSIFGSVPSNGDEAEVSDFVTETDGEPRSELDVELRGVSDVDGEEGEELDTWDSTSMTCLTDSATAGGSVTWLSDRQDQTSESSRMEDSSWLQHRGDESFDDESCWLEDVADRNISEYSWLEQRYLASNSWLDESETSMRRFLSESPPPPEWYHSTSSDSDAE